MPVFAKRVRLPAARLLRSDLEELTRLLVADLNADDRTRIRFSASHGDMIYVEHGLAEFLSQELPNSLDNLTVQVSETKDRYENEKTIYLSLDRSGAFLNVDVPDEVWGRGKIEQMKRFFDRHSLWYARLDMTIIVSCTAGLVIGFAGLNMMEKNYIMGSASGFVGAALFALALLSDRIFPQVDIRISERPRWLNQGTITTIATVILALAGVAGVIVTLMQ